MRDDDLDLELDDEPVAPARPAKPAKTEPVKPAVKPAPAAAKAAKETVPGLIERAKNCFKAPQFNGRTFLTVLVVLLALVLVAENWSPVRFYCLGLALELPKALCFLIDVAIGALLMWLWLRRNPASLESGK